MLDGAVHMYFLTCIQDDIHTKFGITVTELSLIVSCLSFGLNSFNCRACPHVAQDPQFNFARKTWKCLHFTKNGKRATSPAYRAS